MSFFSGIGRALKKVWKSPIGKIVTIAAAAYVGAPAVRSAFEAVSSGGGVGDAVSAFGSKAWDQMSGAGDAVAGIFKGSGPGMQTDVGGGGGGAAPASAASGPWVQDPATGLNVLANEAPKAQAAGGGGGLVSDAFKFIGSPGGALVTSAALKLAGGALTPNETAMRINYEEQKRQEELARQKANTAVTGINFNSIPLTRPQDRLPVPAAPVTVTPRHLG